MRFYQNSKELITEAIRDVIEMGTEVHPDSYQNKRIKDDPNFVTKEIVMYEYALTDLGDPSYLFPFEGRKAKAWCKEEFLERINPSGQVNPGHAWELRKEVWAQFLTSEQVFDYTYNERLQYADNLHRIIQELSKSPNSRQLWLPIFFPKDVQSLGGKRRIPCSLGYFFIKRDGILNLVYVQRSADLYQHFGNDVYLAWLMKDYVAKLTNSKPGYLYHNIFSLHIYKKDWESAYQLYSK